MRRFSFISGKENDQSLKVDYYAEGREVRGEFTPKEHHVSYPETVHGGLLAAILDDAMAYSINQAGIVAYTGKLEMRYRKPPKIGDKLIIRAWIEENKKSLYYTRGVIENNCGEKLVEAKAVFMRPVF